MEDHDVRHLRQVFGPGDPDPLNPQTPNRDAGGSVDRLLELERRISRLEGKVDIMLKLQIALVSGVVGLAMAIIAHVI